MSRVGSGPVILAVLLLIPLLSEVDQSPPLSHDGEDGRRILFCTFQITASVNNRPLPLFRLLLASQVLDIRLRCFATFEGVPRTLTKPDWALSETAHLAHFFLFAVRSSILPAGQSLPELMI